MTYAMLCADLASRGYVVAAVEHRDGSACLARVVNWETKELEWIKKIKIPGNDDEDYPIRKEPQFLMSEENLLLSFLRI